MSTRPPSPEPPPEGENEVQRNIRLKVCAYCKAPGAKMKCKECLQRTYCDKKCQKKDWKAVHKKQCEKLQQVFVPPPAGWREAKKAAERDGSGCGGGAAADDDEFAHPCPVCLDNEDNAAVDGHVYGQCTACGQMYCGGCNAGGRLAAGSPNCPTCRAPFDVSYKEHFQRLWKLVHDRSPGRHTPAAQYNLGGMYSKGVGVKQDHKEAVEWIRKAAAQGHAVAQFNLGFRYDAGKGVKQDLKEAVMWFRKAAEQGDAGAQYNLGQMYDNGRGVKQDHKEAVMWYRKAAEQGDADAQFNLGIMYANGQGVAQDFAKALTWLQLAAEQGDEGALKDLDTMQRRNLFPTPPPGTAVTTILLTSAAGSKYNNNLGMVVTPAEGTVVKPGRVAVLLEGVATPISFKLMNLRV